MKKIILCLLSISLLASCGSSIEKNNSSQPDTLANKNSTTEKSATQFDNEAAKRIDDANNSDVVYEVALGPNEVQIGSQIWSKLNLDVTNYSNGEEIIQVTDANQLKGLKKGAWCYYNFDPNNGAKYGKLYNWYAVSALRGLAPDGWHIPSYDEWRNLLDNLGYETAASQLKSTYGWKSFQGYITCPICAGWSDVYREGHDCSNCNNSRKVSSILSGNGTNSSGFNALPGGIFSFGAFGEIEEWGLWWSSSLSGDDHAEKFIISFESGSATGIQNERKSSFLSVRCIKN